MPYFRQDGAMHGWNGPKGYIPAAPITRIICDMCAELEVPFEPMRTNPDGSTHWIQARPWKWAPWAMGQPCDSCGRTDKEVAHRHRLIQARNRNDVEPMAPFDAWLYAASWGSYITGGDPGACMYGFSEDCRPQSEEHRADCLRWIDEKCLPQLWEHPDRPEYEADEEERLLSLREYLRTASLAD